MKRIVRVAKKAAKKVVGHMRPFSRKKAMRHVDAHRKHYFKPFKVDDGILTKVPQVVPVVKTPTLPVKHNPCKKSGSTQSRRFRTKFFNRPKDMSKKDYDAIRNAVPIEEPPVKSRRKSYIQRKNEKIEAQKRNYSAMLAIFARASSKVDD